MPFHDNGSVGHTQTLKWKTISFQLAGTVETRGSNACKTNTAYENDPCYCPASQEWQWRNVLFTKLPGS